MTQWKVCRQTIHPVQPLYSVCCKINGVPTTDSRLYASRDEAWKRLKKLRAMGEAARTEWRISHRIIHLGIALYQACCKVDGKTRVDLNVYPTMDGARKRVNELNTKRRRRHERVEKPHDAACAGRCEGVRHVVSAPHRKQVAYVFHGTRK